MSSIKIKEVKLLKKGETGLHTTLEDDGPCPGPSVKTGNNRCHQDMINAMQGLRSHLAVLTGYLTEKNAKRVELLENFHVNGYSIGGKPGKEGIVIKGYRINDYGKAVTLNTPFTRFQEEEEEGLYTLIDDLQKKVVRIEEEVVEYITKGKKWEDPQQELDFPSAAPNELNPPGDKITRLHVATPEGEDPENPAPIPGEAHQVKGNKTGGKRRAPQSAVNPSRAGYVE